jgi:serine/threonine protein phosphatase 1
MLVSSLNIPIIYAVGDVHGCANELQHLLDRIEAHAFDRAVERPKVVFLGDYVDRGLHSLDVLEILASPELEEHFDPIRLMGNHDQYMLYACEDRLDGDRLFQWLAAWGGAETVESYGIETGRRPIPDFMAEFRAAVPKKHVRLLEALEFSYRLDGLFFCHAGVAPDVPLERQATKTLLFGCRAFLGHTGDFGARIVHGHFAAPAVEILPNRINVNSSAGYPGGRLSAVAISGEAVEII